MRRAVLCVLFTAVLFSVCPITPLLAQTNPQQDSLVIRPLERLTPLPPMSARESRLQDLLEALSPAVDSLDAATFVRQMAYIYRLQAEKLEAEARGDTVAMESALARAVEALEQLAQHPEATANGRFRELYRSVIIEYEEMYGAVDSLQAEQGEIFAFREEMFAALDALDEPLLEDVQLPELPPMATTVPMEVNRLVEQSIAYLLRSPDRHLLHWMRRAHTYFPMIEKIFREEGVPDELKYLAMIESGLNPRARSWARAAGMWQFIAATGRHYGLRITPWMDERLDPEKSTRAAARHLRDLYDIFGDWHLALAGYNFSPGKLKRIVQRVERRTGRKATFWDVYPYIPRETRNYVPMFIATALVVSNPQTFQLPEVKPGPPYAYDLVPVTGMLDLQTAAELAGTSVQMLRALNPELRRWTTPPMDGVYWLKVPLGSGPTFMAAYEQLPEEERQPVREYVVRRGDALGKIASRYGVSVRALRRANNLRGSIIRVGQRLVIPLPASRTPVALADSSLKPVSVTYGSTTLRPIQVTQQRVIQVAEHARKLAQEVRKQPPRPQGKRIRYKVRPGDTLSEIAEAFGVRISDIRRWNRLRSSRFIRAGQTLTIYARKEPRSITVSRTADGGETYTVRKGDTLSEIAERFNVSISRLKAWNGLTSSRIRVGQKLIVRKASEDTATADNEKIYIVKKGDSLYEIAKKYGISIQELKRMNGLRSNTIRPGQELKIAS